MLAFTNPSFDPQSNLSSSIDSAYFNPFKLCIALVKLGACNSLYFSTSVLEHKELLPNTSSPKTNKKGSPSTNPLTS